MKSIKIDDDKIIIFFGKDEYNLLTGASSPLDEELIGAAAELLVGSGFCTVSDSLYCEIFECGGGCEIFITVHRDRGDDILRYLYDKDEEPANEADLLSRRNKKSIDKYIYSFKDFENLLCACRALCNRNSGASVAKFGEELYLILDEDSPIVGEFSGMRLRDDDAIIVSDRCETIGIDIEDLASLAV